ncbi:hypothetical protein HDU87_001430 [Geranomyces variabilis]|uniref:Uncharacterized protein n=1 Tax=Geranomyces variabilis TaxID=109894 RepID=A0AAD5TB77_9FUNG|nr:hypothetical protein HDU87_001430 [Geranomyces variabilis]
MLGHIVAYIRKGWPSGLMSERDADALALWDLFDQAAPANIRTHFAEIESRASRKRRGSAGASCNYLLTSDSLGTTEGWGTGIGALAGITSPNASEIQQVWSLSSVNIHYEPAKQISETMPDRNEGIHRLHVSRVLYQNWKAVHMVVSFLCGGYYAVKEHCTAELPMRPDSNSGPMCYGYLLTQIHAFKAPKTSS